jgi:hypothetical protein
VPSGRFCVAFDDPTLQWAVTWTALDQAHPSLVAEYQIDRGRQYELDRTDTGRATVTINDRHGVLDPTNASGPYYGKLEPLLQACLCRKHPVTGLWHQRFRGFIEDFSYEFDPSQRVNRLTVSLVDIFEVLSNVEMWPWAFGHDPVAGGVDGTEGQVWFGPDLGGQLMKDRIQAVLFQAHIPPELYVTFSGNVWVQAATYSAGESAMTAIQEAADAEFPGVSNTYTDRFGRFITHGRQAKFDVAGVIATGDPPDHPGPLSNDVWDFHDWQAGDGAAVNADPAQVSHIRTFAFTRGLAKVINHATLTPMLIADEDVSTAEVTLPDGLKRRGQTIYDQASVDSGYGFRAFSAENLLTLLGADSAGAFTVDKLVETQRMAHYFVANYKPRNRISEISFRSMHLTWTGASRLWDLLCGIDIADRVAVLVGSPGPGVGYTGQQHFVEGIHETCRPLNPDMDDVTLSLDLSPVAYFSDLSMFP